MIQSIQDYIYRIPLPKRNRPHGSQMQILALGLPRSGTDSLRSALLTLGYNRVWHGFDLPQKRSDETVLWVPLLRAAARGDKWPARKFDWDILLGDCDVIMDMPPLIFAEELLDFYPNAKVILNRRSDMKAWHASLDKAVDAVMGSRLFWVFSWFDAPLRWWYQSAVLCLGIMGQGKGGFKQNGLRWGIEYYKTLEARLDNDKREYLDWNVKDGWGPLCQFLQKDEPQEEFPWINRSGEEFEKKAEKAVEKMVKRSIMRIAAGVVAVGVGVASIAMYARG